MSSIVAFIAKQLVSGLLSGIGKSFGVKIFDSVFGSSVPSYFTEVYKEIERIMRQEIHQNTIDEIDGQINGLVDWIKNVYNPRKDESVPKTELYELMLPKQGDVSIHMIAVLQNKAFAEAALSVFVIGASIHLVILQELAFVDPDVNDPEKSSYVTSIKKYAAEYADHAVTTYETIHKGRINDITSFTEDMRQYPPFPGQPPGTHLLFMTEWKDKFIGKTFSDATELLNGEWMNGTPEDVRSRTSTKRDDYIQQVTEELKKNLNSPLVVSAEWRKLIDHPLPNGA